MKRVRGKFRGVKSVCISESTRSRQLRLLSLAACVAGASMAKSTFAATETWTGATDVYWADANWSPSGYVPTLGDTAVFNNAGNAVTTIDLGAGVTIGNVLFDSANAAAYTIGNGSIGSQTLTLNDAGTITVNPTVANSQVFNAAITLGTDETAQTYTVTNNSPNTVTFAGNITGSISGATAGVETFAVGGTGNTTVSGNLLYGAAAADLAITKNGIGTLTLSGSNSYTGTTTVNQGTLELDFTAATAPAANIINAGSAVKLAGGTLLINGNATTPSTQTINGLALGPGQNYVTVNNNATLNLGAITNPAVGPTQFSTTGTITTTVNGAGPKGILWNNYATYGTSDWATTDTTGGTAGPGAVGNPSTIIGLSSVSGGYTTSMGGTGQGVNLDLQANYTAGGNVGTQTVRFNTPTATTLSVNGKWIVPNAILVTPNMGANNAQIINGNWFPQYSTSAANTEWIVQNNTQAYFIDSGGLINNRGSSTATVTYVQSGPGTVEMPWSTSATGNNGTNANQYSGASYLEGGATLIKVDADFGKPASGQTIYLDGGSIVGDASVTLDNAGANKRPITILGNGGGLSAAAGTTLTIDGLVSGAAGVGPLVIGIPASSANGNTAGLLPGSGGSSPNPAVNATGNVSLVYTAPGNSQYAPTLITGGATLEIDSQYDLGGADATSVTFNNGTLQYNPSLPAGAAGAATDITTNGTLLTPVIFAGNGTIDTYGHNITYANPIGGGGAGGLTVVDSAAAAARGSLTLSGSNTFTGPTNVISGTLALASGASLASSGVTVNSGATFLAKSFSSVPSGLVNVSSGGILSLVDGTIGTFSGSSLTINSGSYLSYELSGSSSSDTINVSSGGLTINGGKFNLYAVGGATPFAADGTFDLINYLGSDTIAGGPAAINSDLSVNNKVVGLIYNFTDTGSAIQLSITGTPVTSASWSFDGGGSWATAANWSSSPQLPNSAGSTATFGGSASTHANLARTITLDQNETVGTLLFSSPDGESYTINQGTGGGSLILDNSGAGASVLVSGTHVINAPVSLNSSTDINTASSSSLTIVGSISNGINGAQTITKDGLGTLALSGSNTYGPAAGSIGTTINNGSVQVGSSLAFSTGDVCLSSNATVQATATGLNVANNFNVASGSTMTVDSQANSLTFSGVVSGSALTKIGTGTLILSNTQTYTGTTTVSSGTLQLGGGAVGGSVVGNIVDNATVALNRTDDYSLGNLISGTGGLTQNGPDNVTLTGSNTYTGNTVISGGSLILGNSLAIQDSTLNYNGQGGNLSFGTLTTATITGLIGSQALALNNTTPAGVALTIAGTATNTYTGILSGAGSLVMNGTGTVTIGSGTAGGANYSGGTIVNSGAVVLGGVGNLSGGALDLTGVNGVAALTITDNAIINSPSTFFTASGDGGGGGVYPGGGTAIIQGNANVTVAGFSFGNGSRVGTANSLTIAGTATLTINGALNFLHSEGSTVAGTAVNLNGGTLALQQFNYSGGGSGASTEMLNLNGGTVVALANDPSGGSFLAPENGLSVNVDAGGAIINTNGFTDTIATNLLHGLGTTPDGGLTKVGQGTLILSGSNTTYNGPTNASAGVLVISQGGSLPSNSITTVASGATLVDSQNSVLGRAGSLNINGSAIIQSGPNLQNVTQEVAGGYNGGAWNGSSSSAGIPITSSAAASDTTHLHALGVIQNDDGTNTGTPLYTTFEGYSSLNDSDVLIKYTYYGDANLDGKVDGSDYSRIDNGVLLGLSGWFDGDFNYDGVIDGSDYTLIDNSFNTQGAQINAEVASPTAQITGAGISAVPEPASLGLFGIGALGLLGRRQRGRR